MYTFFVILNVRDTECLDLIGRTVDFSYLYIYKENIDGIHVNKIDPNSAKLVRQS